MDQTREIEVFLDDAGITGVRATTAPMPYKEEMVSSDVPVKWRSNKQPKTSLSSAQAEIYALSEACKDVNKCSWVHEEMGRVLPRPMQVYGGQCCRHIFSKEYLCIVQVGWDLR